MDTRDPVYNSSDLIMVVLLSPQRIEDRVRVCVWRVVNTGVRGDGLRHRGGADLLTTRGSRTSGSPR